MTARKTGRGQAASEPQRSRIMVVDDHPIMREGLTRVMEEGGDFLVCAQAESIPRALELLETTRPDLIIVDIALGGQNGLELIKDVKVRHPKLPVLVHSMHEEQVYAQRALRAGARGYLMKQEPAPKLMQAVRQILGGEIYLSETMTRQMLHRMAGDKSGTDVSSLERLSDRELEVFELIGRGQKTKEIAQHLHLSVKTVQTYCEHLKEKLVLRDGTGLVHFAVQWVESQK
jgi:DNA-binding NarL/FixJ family response regulator